MSSVQIRPVRSRRELKRFVKVPFRIHRDSPQWVAPLILDRMQFLNRKKNPWFEHGEAEYLIAERDGEPVGRISAQVDSLWDEKQGGSDAMFGFFETVDDREVAAALLDAATEWAAARGRTRILGPMDFTTNDEVGILIEGFELRPMILENWHPPYYKELLEGLGCGKAMDLLMWELELGSLKEGVKLRPGDPRQGGEGAARRRRRHPQHRQGRPGAGDAPLHADLCRCLGRQLGLRAADRRRGRLPRQDAQAGARRGLGATSPKRTARRSARR